MKALVGTFNQGFTCLYRVEAELDPVSCYTLAGLAANCQSPPQLFIAAAFTPAHAGRSNGTREQRRTQQPLKECFPGAPDHCCHCWQILGGKFQEHPMQEKEEMNRSSKPWFWELFGPYYCKGQNFQVEGLLHWCLPSAPINGAWPLEWNMWNMWKITLKQSSI